MVIAIVFWYLEAKWKVFQYSFSDRIEIIEAYFRDDPNKPKVEPAPFQVYISWNKSCAKYTPISENEKFYKPRLDAHLKNAALHPFVSILYLTIIGLSLGLTFLCVCPQQGLIGTTISRRNEMRTRGRNPGWRATPETAKYRNLIRFLLADRLKIKNQDHFNAVVGPYDFAMLSCGFGGFTQWSLSL